MYSVRVTGLDWWEKRVYYLSGPGLGDVGVFPAFKELDKKLRATLTLLFKPQQGAAGKEYAHGDTGSYLSNLHSLVTAKELKIVEGNPTGGREIREGGPPGSFDEIVAWAVRKLGVTMVDGTRIARKLKRVNKIGTGNSPIMQEHPVGLPVFRFPEWMVTQENRQDIEDAAKKIGSLVVEYLN